MQTIFNVWTTWNLTWPRGFCFFYAWVSGEMLLHPQGGTLVPKRKEATPLPPHCPLPEKPNTLPDIHYFFPHYFQLINSFLIKFWVGQSQVPLLCIPFTHTMATLPTLLTPDVGVEWGSVSFPSSPLQHQLDVLQCNSVLTLPTWRSRQDSTG